MSIDEFEALLATSTLTGLDTPTALTRLATLVDASADVRREDGLRKAIDLGRELLARGIHAEDEVLLHYFIGNAWGCLRSVHRAAQKAAAWEWECPETREEILAYRRAYSHTAFVRLPILRRCQIATNLGNLMSNIGRFVEALAYYDEALELDSRFGMAVGNRGDCLLHYRQTLYDEGHRRVFARAGADLIRRALTLQLEPGVQAGLKAQLFFAEQHAGSAAEELHRQHMDVLGAESDELAYRTWALEEQLFLNPLNDLGSISVAARDVLHLPTMAVAGTVGSGFHGFYNQLKQEYSSARFLLYEGIHQRGRHFADRELVLLDTWNDSALSLSIEKVKLAFRMVYSILDKIAVFVARYFDVELDLHRVTVRSVWYRGGHRRNGLAAIFEDRQNWPLRGLFWLSKDLHEDDEDFHQVLQPDAREVAKLRNQLEHQYARVVEPRVIRSPTEPEPVPPDPFGYVVKKAELIAKAMRVMRTARAALIYLSLAVHREEDAEAPSGAGIFRGSFPVLK